MMLFSFISAIIMLCSISAAAHALLTKRDPTSALGWVAFCLFLPLVGPVIYLIFGINRISAKARELYEEVPDQNDSGSANILDEIPIPFSVIGKSVSGNNAVPCSQFEMLENGEGLFPKMLDAIEAAEHRVYMSSYIFQDDQTGNQFLAALVRAHERRVDVRIIVDGMGAILYLPRIDRKLRRAKLPLRYFDPAKLIPPSLHINMRNHRKLLIVDQDIAFTGGQNISDRHLALFPENRKKALDLHFSFTGAIVVELEKAFLRDWESCGPSSPTPALLPSKDTSNDTAAWTRVILDGPDENLDRLNELLMGVFSQARQRIWIMTPYFLPGPDLVGALIAAKHRGVKVKILLPKKTNIPITQWAMEHSLQHIVARGLTVHLQPAPFVHTKAIIIDDSYSLIGSANLDPRSLRLNFEIAVEVFSQKLNHQLSNYFKDKLTRTEHLVQQNTQDQPLFTRMRNAIAWLMTPYL